MNIRQVFCILLLLVMIPVSSYAQRWKLRRYEASFSIGTSQFYGDIGGTAEASNLAGFKDIQLRYIRPSFALGARYKLRGDMAVKMNLIYGFITGNDVNSRNDNRSYSFTSRIFEPSFQFEYYLISENSSSSSPASFSHKGMVNNFAKIYFYAFGGVGGIIGNPKLYDNKVISKPVLITPDNISKFGIAFPLGLGLKFTIDAKWTLGFELGRRLTTTDLIDGYTSEWSKHRDLYDFGMFSIIYKIETDRRGYPILIKAKKYRR